MGERTESLQGGLSVERMCQLAAVSRAGYYRSFREKAPEEEALEVRAAVQQVVLEHRRRYGYRRVTAELRRRSPRSSTREVGFISEVLLPKRFIPGTWAPSSAELAALWIAEGSPLVALDDDLLSIHMIQHVLLMGVAPPLILLGAPALPLLHGLPQRFVRGTLGPLLRWQPIQRLGRTLTHPAICWLSAMGALVAWHTPALFELALRSDAWHEVEHACFFGTGLLFWWPVVQPWPSVARWPRWRIPLYLFMATLPCDVLSAFLTFCDRVVYSPYLMEPRKFSISPLLDQECTGALMWTCATFTYLISAVIITVQILSSSDTLAAERADGAFRTTAGRRLDLEAEVVQ